mmetsp:Transcript_16767/g.30380  ORF Transcript_16767/g.30380 Transcript_16767/m.30380 type:complete len:287 (-) Transcript_16767:1688-2548(-)
MEALTQIHQTLAEGQSSLVAIQQQLVEQQRLVSQLLAPTNVGEEAKEGGRVGGEEGSLKPEEKKDGGASIGGKEGGKGKEGNEKEENEKEESEKDAFSANAVPASELSEIIRDAVDDLSHLSSRSASNSNGDNSNNNNNHTTTTITNTNTNTNTINANSNDGGLINHPPYIHANMAAKPPSRPSSSSRPHSGGSVSKAVPVGSKPSGATAKNNASNDRIEEIQNPDRPDPLNSPSLVDPTPVIPGGADEEHDTVTIGGGTMAAEIEQKLLLQKKTSSANEKNQGEE